MFRKLEELLEDTISQLAAIDPERTKLLLSFRNRSLGFLKILKIPDAELEGFKEKYLNADEGEFNKPEFLYGIFNPENHVVESNLDAADKAKREQFNQICTRYIMAAEKLVKEDKDNLRLKRLPLREMLLVTPSPFTVSQYYDYAHEVRDLLSDHLCKSWEDRECLGELLADPNAELDTLLFEGIRRGLTHIDPEIRRITRISIYLPWAHSGIPGDKKLLKDEFYDSLIFDKNLYYNLSGSKWYYNESSIFSLCPVIAHSSISHLDLSHTDMAQCPTNVPKTIAEAVKAAPNLTMLNVTAALYYILRNNAAIPFLQIVAESKVRELNLSDNHIGELSEESFTHFIDLLPGWRLLKLNLEGNGFSPTQLQSIITAFQSNLYIQELLIDGLDEGLTQALNSILDRNKILKSFEFDVLLEMESALLKELSKEFKDDEERKAIIKKVALMLEDFIATVEGEENRLEVFKDNNTALERITKLRQMRDNACLKAAALFSDNKNLEEEAKALVNVSPQHPRFLSIRLQIFDSVFRNSGYDLEALILALPCLVDRGQFLALDEQNIKAVNTALFAIVETHARLDEVRSLSNPNRVLMLQYVLLKYVLNNLNKLSGDPIRFSTNLNQAVLKVREQLLLEQFLTVNPATLSELTGYRSDINRTWLFVIDQLNNIGLQSDTKDVFAAVDAEYLLLAVQPRPSS